MVGFLFLSTNIFALGTGFQALALLLHDCCRALVLSRPRLFHLVFLLLAFVFVQRCKFIRDTLWEDTFRFDVPPPPPLSSPAPPHGGGTVTWPKKHRKHEAPKKNPFFRLHWNWGLGGAVTW